MPNYNTQGITSADPRNLGGSEGYGNPTASTSSGIMSNTSNPTANDDDNNDEPSFFESIANLFSGAGADLPSGGNNDDDGDSGISFYDSPMFTPYDGGSDNDTTPQGGLPFETTAADRALYEALGVDVPEVYQGKMGEEEPDPNFDPDVLQDALQPEPITVEEIEVKAGDTLTAIAEEKGVPVQDVIDANPQIKNPDLIRPGEKVTVPGILSAAGELLKVATDPQTPAPVSEDPDREFYQSGIPLEERFPAEADTGEGLMSDPRKLGGAEGYGSVGTPAESDTFASLIVDGNTESIASSTHLTNTFDAFKDVEGDTNHVDGRGYFTMPFGVVPDKNSVKKADGTAFDPRSDHGYTTSTAGKVDTSNATHTLKVGKNSYVVKRADYDSDEAFAKGVVSLYNREAAKKYGSGWDELKDNAKEMALDMSWNGGIGAVGWSSVKKALKEAGKEEPDTKNLFAFTVNFRSSTEYPRGLFKRRLIQYNKIANDADIASTYSTEAVMSKGKRVGTKYIAERADGTVIGSWSYTDKADDPSTKDINEARTPSSEKLKSNVIVSS